MKSQTCWINWYGRILSEVSQTSARGLGDPLLVVSDGAPGIIKAIETCIAHLRIPVDHRRAIRTTNLLERLFVEERRRLKIIPNAFGEKPVLKLMFSAMIRTAERWRAIRVTDFERRQMEAVRKELDHEYEARNGLVPKTSANADQTKLSSTSRTRLPKNASWTSAIPYLL